MGVRRAGDEEFATARERVVPKEREFFKLEKLSAFLEKTDKFLGELFHLEKVKELKSELSKLKQHVDELDSSMEISPGEYEKHLHIDHADIHPEKIDDGRWKIQIVIYPRSNEDADKVKQLVKEELKIEEDLGPVRGFLEQEGHQLGWEVAPGKTG